MQDSLKVGNTYQHTVLERIKFLEQPRPHSLLSLRPPIINLARKDTAIVYIWYIYIYIYNYILWKYICIYYIYYRCIYIIYYRCIYIYIYIFNIGRQFITYLNYVYNRKIWRQINDNYKQLSCGCVYVLTTNNKDMHTSLLKNYIIHAIQYIFMYYIICNTSSLPCTKLPVAKDR